MSIELKEVAAALHGMVDDQANNKVSMFYRVFPIKANEPRTKLELRRWNYYVKSTKPHGPGDLKVFWIHLVLETRHSNCSVALSSLANDNTLVLFLYHPLNLFVMRFWWNIGKGCSMSNTISKLIIGFVWTLTVLLSSFKPLSPLLINVTKFVSNFNHAKKKKKYLQPQFFLDLP